MLAQPGYQVLEAKRVGLVQSHDEFDRLFGGGGQPRIVDGKKSIERVERCALVAIDEGVILRETLPQRGSLFDQIVVIPRLGTKNGGFQRAFVSKAACPAKPFDLFLMNCEDICFGEEVAHSASFRYTAA